MRIYDKHLSPIGPRAKARVAALLIAFLMGFLPVQTASSMSSVNLLGQASGYLSIWLGDGAAPPTGSATVIDRVQLDDMTPSREIVLNVKTNFMQWNVSASAKSEGAGNEGQNVSSLNKIDFQCTSADGGISTFPKSNLSQLRSQTSIAAGSAPTDQQGAKLRVRYSLNNEHARESITAVIQYRIESTP